MKRCFERFLLSAVLAVCVGSAATAEDVVYVVNSNVHGAPAADYSTVMMVRNDTFAILKAMALPGRAVHTVAVTPDGTRLWVTSPPDNLIYVIDAASFTIADTIDLGVDPRGPMGVDFTPDGVYAYVTLDETGDVIVYEAVSLAYVTTIDLDGRSNFIVFNPSGTRAYVVDYQNSTITVIQTSTNTVMTTLDCEGPALQDAVVSPDGSHLYCSNMQEDKIEVIRTSDNTLLDPIPTAIRPRGIGISPDGNYLFVGHYTAADAYVNMMRLSDNAVVSSAPIPSNPRRIAVKDNGRRIVVTEHNEDELYAMTVDGESLAPTFSCDLNLIPGVFASPVGVAFGTYSHPVPDVKINGSDGPLILTASDSATLSLQLDSGGRSEVSDWFLIAFGPDGILFWTPTTGWTTAALPLYVGAIFDLGEVAFPPVSGATLSPGHYFFFFGVDVKGNGLMNPLYLYVDFVWMYRAP